MLTVVIDYGMGNLGSVRRAFEECGSRVEVKDRPSESLRPDRLVLPGVGAFKDGIERLKSSGWADYLKNQTGKEGIPLLGICLGMQLLADESEEGGRHPGLGLIHGKVIRLRSREAAERVPHVGWNEVVPSSDQGLFGGIPAGADFYFVHSFHLAPEDRADAASRTPYCGEFVSAVSRGKVWGVQFHPEKSSKHGFQLIRNFLTEGAGC